MTVTNHSSILLKTALEINCLAKRICYIVIRVVHFLKSIINISNYPFALEVVFFFFP